MVAKNLRWLTSSLLLVVYLKRKLCCITVRTLSAVVIQEDEGIGLALVLRNPKSPDS